MAQYLKLVLSVTAAAAPASTPPVTLAVLIAGFARDAPRTGALVCIFARSD